MKPGSNMTMNNQCFRKVLLTLLLILIVGIGADAVYLVAEHNFHVVTAGQVYRSSRMSPEALTTVIQSHGIKSVLSLVGPSLTESNAVRLANADYFDVSISDRHEVTEWQMDEIISILRTAPKPVLIHCKAGADRTGLAASLYHYAVEGEPADRAAAELTLFDGHLPPGLGFSTGAMDRSFWRYVHSHAPGKITNAPVQPEAASP
jgi:hypothetical protein